jgi:hypothetical protein
MLLLSIQLLADDRDPYYPYVTGDGFRAFADHIYDETNTFLDPESVEQGDVIFVKGDLLEQFSSLYANRIPNRFIVLVHNSDENIGPRYQHFLDTPHLIVCFAQNVSCFHEKLKPIPIGLQNRYLGERGDCTSIELAKTRIRYPRRAAVYVNFAPHFGREEVMGVFKKLNQVYFAPRTGYLDYLRALGTFRFIASPPGNGVDCHRHWEALYMGSIPIIQSGYLDPLFEDLPVLLVGNWEEVTDAFLVQKHKEISKKSYSMNKLNSDYWFNQINSYRNQ